MLKKENTCSKKYSTKCKSSSYSTSPTNRQKGAPSSSPSNHPHSHIVLQHWGIATALANEYRNIPKLEFDDILQQARIGLAKAAIRYDTTKGTAFSTYAWRVIQNDLNTLYTKQQRRALKEVSALDRPYSTFGDEPDPQEDNTLDQNADVFAEIRQREVKTAIYKAVTKLPERQQKVIYGILAGKDYRDIGRQLGFSDASAKTLVSRAYQNSLKNLRIELEKQGFKPEE